LLLKKLKSLKRIKEADIQLLTEAIGSNKAKVIYDYFHQT